MKPIVYEGMKTPWGKAQGSEVIFDWLGVVETSSHGGYKLDKKHNGYMPLYLQRKNGWYEEDCAWSLPFVVFEEKIKLEAEVRQGEQFEFIDKIFREEIHKQTFKNWFWKEYELFYDVILSPSESYLKKDYMFNTENLNNWVIICALEKNDGTVNLTFTKGGNRKTGAEEKNITILKEVYTRIRDVLGFSKIALTEKQLEFIQKI